MQTPPHIYFLFYGLISAPNEIHELTKKPKKTKGLMSNEKLSLMIINLLRSKVLEDNLYFDSYHIRISSNHRADCLCHSDLSWYWHGLAMI